MCVGRGRRRLDFKRFQGKSLFLDLPGYRQMAWLEEELTARGAVSEGERRERKGGREDESSERADYQLERERKRECVWCEC